MSKIIIKNKEAFFNFEILTKYEAGMVLDGWEVKSIRANNISLKGSFCSFKGVELFVSNVNISQYMNVVSDSTRPRKLLLHKSQLKKMREGVKTLGYTIVPLNIKLSSKGLVKMDVALARGKTKVDKREIIKKRDIERNLKKLY